MSTGEQTDGKQRESDGASVTTAAGTGVVAEVVSRYTATLRGSGTMHRGGTEAKIREIVPMTPDASLRRYFRVLFDAPLSSDSTDQSLVAMVFDSVASPETGGDVQVRADDAFVELGSFLAEHGVAVPRILHDARDRAVILIEDLGDVQLADIALSGDMSRLEAQLPQALAQIRAIQRIPSVPAFFPFRRTFSAAAYRREMEELRDFILIPRGARNDAIAAAERLFVSLADTLAGFPQVLVHRDFHGWNLIIDPHEKLRVIDFQDALLATSSYDLVSLINDRDMDQALGVDLYRKCVRQFAGLLVKDGVMRSEADFLAEYDQVPLQRDLKVAGRFGKLVSLRGLNHYGQWIPGTLRRIGRTIERMIGEHRASSEIVSFYEAARGAVPEFEEGAATPVRL